MCDVHVIMVEVIQLQVVFKLIHRYSHYCFIGEHLRCVRGIDFIQSKNGLFCVDVVVFLFFIVIHFYKNPLIESYCLTLLVRLRLSFYIYNYYSLNESIINVNVRCGAVQ